MIAMFLSFSFFIGACTSLWLFDIPTTDYYSVVSLKWQLFLEKI